MMNPNFEWNLREFAKLALVNRTMRIVSMSSCRKLRPFVDVFFMWEIVFASCLYSYRVVGSAPGATSCTLAQMYGRELTPTYWASARWLVNSFWHSGVSSWAILSAYVI